jgi:enterochelin esterase family protein
MKFILAAFSLLATAVFSQTPAAAPNTEAYYKLSPDSLPQDGVPKGQIKGPFTLPSQAYPGTQHTYWIYVPAQYNSATPASLMIYNDGQAFMAPEGDIRDTVERSFNGARQVIYR